MYRTSIERLEERKLFSVTDLIIDPFEAQNASSATTDEPPAIVDYLDQDEISTPRVLAARTESVGKNETITIGGQAARGIVGNDLGVGTDRITATYNGDARFNIVGDFNGDGVDDLATFTVDSRPEMAALNAGRNQDIEVENDETHFVGRDAASSVVAGNFIGVDGGSNLIIVVCSRTPSESYLLPYVEQDNLYKLHDGAPRIADVIDGTSNTLMFADHAGFVAALYSDLLGISFDPLPLRSTAKDLGLDVWEHGYSSEADGITTAFPDVFKHADSSQHGAAANGILIGLLVPEGIGTPTGTVTFALAVDPSDPSGNATYGISFCFADGSPRFIRVDTTGMGDFAGALAASNEYRSNAAASLLASDEYFSRFTNTTFDDEAGVSVLLGNGDGTFQITHDAEFEKWASVSQFDRSYLSLGIKFSDVLVSSIHAGPSS